MKPDEKEAENIRVAVRCRPMNERENREQSVSCFTCGPNGTAVLTNMDNPAEKHEFGFDFVYGCDSKQESVFEDIGVPLLDRAFGGYNGTIFAYGQTGSGKSFSMTGVTGGPEALEGLIPRVNRTIFERVANERVEYPNKRFLVECSYFEIYNEIIYDLLDSSGNGKKNKGGLEIKEHSVLGIYVKDLQERVVETREEIVELMALGAQSRTVGYTHMNAESSRSHSIFTIKIHQKDADDETKSVFAKINLVDLAGSERAASTGAQGDRLREGANINKSLSALGNVINALVEASRASKKVFIPYRNSKLTRVLQESLGGNSLCSMLATLSPASINFVETLSTLKYASRAKSIKVNAKKNEASSQISQLNEEIAALKQKLQEQMEATLGLDPKEKDEIVTKYEKQIQEMDQRTKKWRLLEEKGDLELMMRALRDLDGNNSAAADAEAASVAVQWLETAQKVKTMEGEAKDLRTLIQVFRDSLQKDVELWARRCGLTEDSTKSTKNLLPHRREDSAAASAAHMTASQMGSKLQNIGEESEKLLTLEGQLVSDRSALINTMTRELLRLKARHAQLKAEQAAATAAAAGKTTPNATQAAKAAKEAEQLLEERERGLTITLALVRTQRSTLVQSIKSDRQRIFEFATVTKHFISFADQHIVSSQVAEAKSSEVAQRWEEAKAKLLAVSKTWEDTWNAKSADDTSSAEYVGDGDVAALGLESRLLSDECFSASSKAQDAKFVRLNGAQCWIPDAQDTAPSLVVDFELPRIFDSVSLRGGKIQIGGSSGSSEAQPATLASAPSPAPLSTFVLASTDELKSARARCKLDDVTGTNELTYELLAHVMSWQDLLKTDVIPVKLFARPPVRFLHDVISAVMRNTGFACDAVSAAQRDYAQLPSKTDRSEYLSAVLDYVQAWYHRQQQNVENAPSVIIAATTSNILAAVAVQEQAPAAEAEADAGSKPSPDTPQDGWVTRLRVATSFTGNAGDWRVLGAFDANTDAEGTVSIALAAGETKADGVEQAASYNLPVLVLAEARALYDRAKAAESEKHAQLASYGEELAKLRAASAAWEKKEREMQEQHAHLTAQIETANQRAIGKKLAEILFKTLSMQAGEQKRTHEALQQTKQQLEELATNLRAQLTDKKQEQDASQQEGQSRIAELNGELMSVHVQLDEQRRALEAAELQSKEQEAFGQQQYSLLQQTRAALMEKGAEADAKLKARAAESEAALRDLHDERDRVKQDLERALAAENLLKLAAGRLEAQCAATGAELDSWRRRAEAAEAEVQAHLRQVALQVLGPILAMTNELRRLAELEKMEAKVQSLEQELAASEEKACQAEHSLLESAKRVKELEETEEELQLQLQVVTDERDSARQKEEQLFAETNEKDQEIERIRDGYVWVTDRMNSKEDELSELQEQLERYQSLLEMTGAKAGAEIPPAKPKEDKWGTEIAKLYVLAIGATDATAGSDTMIAKLAEWIEVMKTPTKAAPKHETPSQQRDCKSEKPAALEAVPNNNGPSAEEETDYDDDFDDADEKDEAQPDESAWPRPPPIHARKGRNSTSAHTRRRPRCRTPLTLCSTQQSYRSPPTPKTSRCRSRHLAIYQSPWMTTDGLNSFIHYCSTVVKVVVSTMTAIAQTLYETASTMLQSWWRGKQEDDTISLEVVERQSTAMQDINEILEENNRLKRMIKFAMSSHVIMNEATIMLQDGADLSTKPAEDVVDVKVHEVELERDALALQLEELQEQLEDKDQEIERLRDGYGTNLLLLFRFKSV
ncbi:Kinesin-like protein [Phytophthora cactorum]|nr:Kinesin-like protein [Phytophthora cactorum]